MATGALSQQETEDRLRELPGWSVTDGRLARTYRLGTHFAAAALVVHVARIQDESNHHSELTLGYNTVAVAVRTHDAGGALTEKDFALARRVEEIAPSHGAS
ncbi:4a-hydroxytetrahydrobiopterin dehydratase [Streptomyces hebeiensis]|uniref:Putative pterin-4-alpha-carbinolamine dehydratase n=1 Tax=Streptomyces hebeiensis TaxID=229486 RepID=A0ABN1V3X2_9ACTN